MANFAVANLMQFRLELYFDHEMIVVGASESGPDLEVREATWELGQGPVWTAMFRGAKVVFGFQLQPRSQWTLLTTCTACRSGDCWHVAAVGRRILMTKHEVLDAWQERADAMGLANYGFGNRLPPARQPAWQPTPEQEFERWLSTRASAPSGSAERERPASAATSELLFVITPGYPKVKRISLEAATSRKLKSKDAMSKPTWLRDLAPERPHQMYMSDPLYERYARWCASNFRGMQPQERWSSLVVDEAGVDLIKGAAEAGRLYIHDLDEGRPAGPVKWSDPRSIEWSWDEKAGGEVWAITHQVAGGGRAFFGPVPLYADLASSAVGVLDLQGMDTNSAEMVLTAPAVPKSWLNKNVRSPEALRYLPRPPEKVVQRSSRVILGVVPTPVLTVEVKDRKEIFALDLAFRYADVLEYFTAEQERIQIVKKADEAVEVVRDMEAEARARAAMRDAGFLRAPAGDWRFAGDKAAQVEGFRELLATDFEKLRAAGFEIATVTGWASKVQQAESVAGGFEEGDDHDEFERSGTTRGLEFSMGFTLEGQRFNLLPLVSQILEVVGGVEGINRLMAEQRSGSSSPQGGDPKVWVVDESGKWIGLPRAGLLPWLAVMAELIAGRRVKEMTAPSLTLSRIEALRLEASVPELELGGAGAKIIGELLAAKACRNPIDLKGFTGTLEPFQLTGVHWLRVLEKYQLGGLLGDDRGLGKTWQVIAHINDMKQRGTLSRPALIVVIPSQKRHWEKLLNALTPELTVLVLQGAQTRVLLDTGEAYDVVVTTWAKVALDIDILAKHRFQVVYLDETALIHNQATNLAKAVRLLNAGHAIALNGSPVENSFTDLFAVMDAVLHGFLGSAALFKRMFSVPIEDHQDHARLLLLRKRLAPFMLRRRKEDSGVSLPPVRHEDIGLRISGEQANLYEIIRITTEARIQEALAVGGARASKTSILAILVQLRQVCCDPRLTEIGRDRGMRGSAKLEWLAKNIGPMVKEGRRILLVCYFSGFFDLIGPVLDGLGIRFSMIRAGVTNREAQKEAFKDGSSRVFLLGLKAGGRGLDLPEADTVIHLDPWYNPKAHDQATDRAHRMGQKNTVLNLRLFIEGSFEERVIDIQERKRVFADSLDDEGLLDEAKITEDDVRQMLRPLQALDDDDQ